MSKTTEKNDVYEYLNSEQKEIAVKIETLLVGLTIREAREMLHRVARSISETTTIN